MSEKELQRLNIRPYASTETCTSDGSRSTSAARISLVFWRWLVTANLDDSGEVFLTVPTLDKAILRLQSGIFTTPRHTFIMVNLITAVKALVLNSSDSSHAANTVTTTTSNTITGANNNSNTASVRVFDIVELLEKILRYASPNQLFTLRCINKTFRDTIARPKSTFPETMFLEPQSSRRLLHLTNLLRTE